MADDKLRKRHEEGDEVAQRAVMGERCRAGHCCAHRVPERELTEEEEVMLERIIYQVDTSILREGNRPVAKSLIERIHQVFLRPLDDAKLAAARHALRRGIDAGDRLHSKEITPEDLVNEIRERPL